VVGRPAVRYARGAQRRTALVEAAAALLLEQGLAALSHRAVAARAGLPLASTTYYFGSVEDLRDEALQHVALTWGARAAGVVQALPPALDLAQAAWAVVGVLCLDVDEPQLLLLYERYLEAGRHERLRPLVVGGNARLAGLVAEVLRRAGLPAGPAEVQLVLAVADGVAVTALAEGAAPEPAVRAALDRLLGLLQRQ
jgi:DNA-binding transcriptional regulator YbjK